MGHGGYQMMERGGVHGSMGSLSWEVCIIPMWGLVDAWVLGGRVWVGGRAKREGACCLCTKSMQDMSW